MITASFGLNLTGFLGGIREINKHLGHVRNIFTALTGTVTGLRAGFDLLAGAAAPLKETLNLGGTLADLSANTGAGVADLVLLRQAFENAGLGADAVGPALAKLQKALAGVNEDGDETRGVFAKLGVSAQSLSRMSAVEQLKALSVAFAQVPDPAQRTALAMQLFGRAGANMMALLRDPQAFATAADQVGRFGEVMEANASRFDSIGDAIGALGGKMQQFWAGLASKLTDNGIAESLSKIDLTEIGEKMGSALRAASSAISNVVSAFSPLIPAMKAAAAYFIGMRAVPAILGAVSAAIASVTSAVTALTAAHRARAAAAAQAAAAEQAGQARSTYAAMPLAKVPGVTAPLVSVATGAALATRSFGTMARAGLSAAAGLLKAFAPIAALMAGFAVMDHFKEKVAKRQAQGDAQGAILDETDTQRKTNAATLGGVGNEDERSAAAATLTEQLDAVHEKLRNIAKDHPELDSKGITEVSGALQMQAKWIEIQQKQLAEIPPEVMAARMEERRRGEEIAESARRADELRKGLKKAGEDYDAFKKKQSFDALSYDDQRASLFHGSLRGAIEPSEALLDSAIARARAEPAPSNQQIEWLATAIEASKQLTEINKKRADAAGKAAEAETAHGEKTAMLRAELAGNERVLKQLRREQNLRERIRELTAAGVKDPGKKAAEEIGLEEGIDAKKQRGTMDDYAKKYSRDMQKLDAQMHGDDAKVREIETEEKTDQYEKEAREAGVTDPAKARALAKAKANAEQKEKPKGVAGVADSDRRVGLGGNFFGGGKPEDKAARASRELKGSIDKLNGILSQDKPPTVLVPKLVFG